ncbi:hypothetical protein TNIN_324361 [Trichonephila inaurata madagascariensis]|uniref:Uncharacterized protein n=1 Tax=Trichonephila inaurata madagascariensis TaxID=2747483 RepID=A0A8X6XNE7_9ARAC|nr:hypothetical protein TNIN_324361 [Trichonephila inaurata madagascariensis]
MVSNGFRREMDSRNEGIQEHVPVGLPKLMRTFDPKEDQMKEEVSRDIQQHFIDDWGRIVSVNDLAEKLDNYEKTHDDIIRPLKLLHLNHIEIPIGKNLACSVEDVIHLVKDMDKNLTTAVDMISESLSKNQLHVSIVDE